MDVIVVVNRFVSFDGEVNVIGVYTFKDWTKANSECERFCGQYGEVKQVDKLYYSAEHEDGYAESIVYNTVLR